MNTVLNRVRGQGRRNRSGFTLIEIVVVVAIIAILAMLLVPRLAFIRTMATYANEASSIQDVTQNLLTYHATQAVWPDHFDSLMDSAGATWFGWEANATNGLDTNLKGVLVPTTLDANTWKSLQGLLGQPNGSSAATVTVEDQDQVSQPGDSGTIDRSLASGSSVMMVNFTSSSTLPSPWPPSDPNAASAAVIYNTVFPGGVNPKNNIIIALGVGPRCTAVGKTILTPPQAYNKDATRYNRTIILIRLDPTGVQASLAGALSPDGRTLNQNLGNYRVTAQR